MVKLRWESGCLYPSSNQAIFCNTSIQEEGGGVVVATPSLEFSNRTPYKLEYNRPRRYVVMTSQSMAEPANCDFSWKIGETFKILLWRFQIWEFHRPFCLCRRKSQICSVSFHSMQIFFQNGDLMSKNEKCYIHSLTLWRWRLTLPRVRCYPQFVSIKMTVKGCKRDYLYALAYTSNWAWLRKWPNYRTHGVYSSEANYLRQMRHHRY